jgi:hypothetical protein
LDLSDERPQQQPPSLSFHAMEPPSSPLFAVEDDVEHSMAGRRARSGVEEDVVEQLHHDVATVGNHGPEGENKEQVRQSSIWSINFAWMFFDPEYFLIHIQYMANILIIRCSV